MPRSVEETLACLHKENGGNTRGFNDEIISRWAMLEKKRSSSFELFNETFPPIGGMSGPSLKRNMGPFYDVTTHYSSEKINQNRNFNDCAASVERPREFDRKKTKLSEFTQQRRFLLDENRNSFGTPWTKPSWHHSMSAPGTYALKHGHRRSLSQNSYNTRSSPRAPANCLNFIRRSPCTKPFPIPIGRAKSDIAITQGDLRKDLPSIETTLKCASNLSVMLDTAAGVMHLLKHCSRPELQLKSGVLPADLANIDLRFAKSLSMSDLPSGSRSSQRSETSLMPDSLPYECKGCGMAFPDRGWLARHEHDNPDHMPYWCGICGKRFTSEALLQCHKTTHTTRKNSSECGRCGKYCTNTRCLMAYSRKFHTSA